MDFPLFTVELQVLEQAWDHDILAKVGSSHTGWGMH